MEITNLDDNRTAEIQGGLNNLLSLLNQLVTVNELLGRAEACPMEWTQVLSPIVRNVDTMLNLIRQHQMIFEELAETGEPGMRDLMLKLAMRLSGAQEEAIDMALKQLAAEKPILTLP